MDESVLRPNRFTLEKNMDSPVNVGVTGYGYSGRDFHSYLIGFEKRLRLRAVCVLNPDRRKHAEKRIRDM
jgi:hypothetical protein